MKKNKFVYNGKLYEVIAVDDKPTKIKKIIKRLLFIVGALSLLLWCCNYFLEKDNDKREPVSLSSVKSLPNKPVEVIEKPDFQLEVKELEPAPVKVQLMKPYPAHNGEIIIKPDYECICPLKVETEPGISAYYVRLHYLGAPNSDKKRKLNYSASPPYQSDIAFYIKAGATVEIDVPVGIYKFYYATGQTFYGSKELFGNSTSFYTSDEVLHFYVEGNRLAGNFIELKKVIYGNFSTHGVNKNSFPTD